MTTKNNAVRQTSLIHFHQGMPHTFECGGAGITALVVHWLDEGPLVGLREVALGCVLPVVAVVTSHGVDQPVMNCCTHVTPMKIIYTFFSTL